MFKDLNQNIKVTMAYNEIFCFKCLLEIETIRVSQLIVVKKLEIVKMIIIWQWTSIFSFSILSFAGKIF